MNEAMMHALRQRGAAIRTVDYLGILSDPEYMAGVKEKLELISTYATDRVAAGSVA